MLRVARYALAAISITLTLAGCQDAAAPLSTVDRVPVAFVTVEPPTAIALAGQTVQLTATTKDADGKLLTDRVVTWASGNKAVATVSSRSEEHTSELQSQSHISYAVFCLKKK